LLRPYVRFVGQTLHYTSPVPSAGWPPGRGIALPVATEQCFYRRPYVNVDDRPFSKRWYLARCSYPAGVFFLKWDDQSHFRELFAMEWYVLGNEWDFSAVNPDMAPAKNTSGTSRFGLQYSDYYSSTGANSSAARNGNTNVAFNELENMGQRATANLFTGKLDGQLFAPMQVDYGSVYASMVFRTADKRQVMFVWIYETAAGEDASVAFDALLCSRQQHALACMYGAPSTHHG
jgi:hypothetical protein